MTTEDFLCLVCKKQWTAPPSVQFCPVCEWPNDCYVQWLSWPKASIRLDKAHALREAAKSVNPPVPAIIP